VAELSAALALALVSASSSAAAALAPSELPEVDVVDWKAKYEELLDKNEECERANKNTQETTKDVQRQNEVLEMMVQSLVA
jgi:hypothetical protein